MVSTEMLEAVSAPLWIPAFAGMTKSGSLITYDARQGDFPFNLLPKGVRACIIRS